MRFLYTFIMGGLLVLTEIPAQQPSPYVTLPVAYFGTTQSFFPIQYSAMAVEGQPLADAAREPLQEIVDALPAEVKALPTLLPASLPTSLPTPLTKTAVAESALATYWQQTSLPVTGYAMFYNPNVMQEVLRYRLATGEVSSCSECIGNVALLRAGDLNRRVWLQWGDGALEGPFLVADVAARHHVDHLLARDWVVDVDYPTAVRRKMAGPVMVTVWASPPAGSQTGAPPFAPLYATMPTVESAANTTLTPLLTPAATATLMSPVGAGVLPQVGFPPDTPVPTVTPLPALSGSPSATVAAPTLATVPTAIPIAMPTVTPTAIATVAPTVTPIIIPAQSTLPAGAQLITTTPPPTHVVMLGGLPPDTPAPTSTPLPAIASILVTTPATVASVASPANPPTNTPTTTPTSVPAYTLTAIVHATIAATAVVTLGGFPPDTPVPTVTPLPVINTLLPAQP